MNDVGLPDQYTFRKLSYSSHSKRLLVSVTIRQGAESRERIFERSVSAKRYVEIPYPAGDFSYRHLTVSQCSPVAYFTQWAPQGFGIDWSCLFRYELESREVELVLRADDLRVGRGRRWLSAIMGVSASGDRLYCSVAEESRLGDVITVQYALCDLDVRTHQVELVTALDGVFV